jgi:hypothetical protein
MRLKEVALLVFLVVCLVCWFPVFLLLALWRHSRVNKKNVVRVGSKLSHLSLTHAREFDPAFWLCLPFISGHLQTIAVLFKLNPFKGQRWYDERTALSVEGCLPKTEQKQSNSQN